MEGKEKRTVEVRGREYEVDEKALGSWRAFNLVRKMESGREMEKVDAAIGFVELVCGATEDDIVEACGGDDAEAAEVIAVVFDLIKGCYPKN